MYSRGFGTETDGGFRELDSSDRREPFPEPDAVSAHAECRPQKKGIFGKLDTEDLLLIGIALLLLTDSNGDNDMLSVLLLALLLF